jgi:arsenical pump membrane protein
MIVPQAVALLATYFLLRRLFRKELSSAFDHRTIEEPHAVIGHSGYFTAACAVLGLTLVGFFLAPFLGVDPYLVGFGGVVILGICGIATKRVQPREVLHGPWALVIFVLGLVVIVQSIENLGFSEVILGRVKHLRGISGVFVASGAAALVSNVCNNLPATLLAIPVLQRAPAPSLLYGTSLGVNIGPNLLPSASLATMLVLSIAREKGVEITGRDVLRAGVRTTPLVLVAAAVGLALTFVARP